MAASPRTVVVTGASKGIGAATVRRLAGRGVRVIAGVRREEDGAALKEQLADRVLPVQLDVTDQDAIAAAAEVVRAEVAERGLNGLVNNAGIAVAAPVEFLPPGELRHQLEVNVIGQIAVTQALVPLLRAARGRIVNVGSIGDRIASPMLGAYTASKFALAALTDTMRMELSRWGIEVSLIEPGAVATPIWGTSVAAADRLLEAAPESIHELYGGQVAAARASARRNDTAGIPPDEVARVIEHALTARRPRTRYLVGRDARIASVVARLPDRLRDRLVLSQSG
ncbi:SDR family oxidoreductase [Gandjariella thermophila]|uniref:Short-chain dehydrogenase n=1 Tax=Gandjariella thermophila TaxID=1931992 RepID=A0A4D4J7I4_9PSEU|nr:SDR family oxidoreductase [Gandjariella thermophila]GDY30469.1 short-chain dehydrogenase [Gandjariella thermophila]